MAIEIILIAVVVFLVAMLGMALGAIFGKRCLRGSCGGLSSLRTRVGLPLCEHCEHAAEQPLESAEAPTPRDTNTGHLSQTAADAGRSREQQRSA